MYDFFPWKGILIWTATIVALLAIPGYFWGWHVYGLRALFVTGGGQFFLVLAGGFLLLSIVAAVLADAERTIASGVTLTLAILAVIASPIIGGLNTSYITQTRYLEAASIEKVKETPLESYDARVPWEIASAQVNSNMGNFQGESYQTKALADQGEIGEWNALVAAKGVGVGYEGVVSIDSPIYGDVKPADVLRCEVNNDNASLRLGGMLPHNDLVREILNRIYFSKTVINGEDVYGYCNEENEPIVVVPIIENQGFIFNIQAPWGVAIYNGETGNLEITQDAKKIAALEGATYPESIAAAQRHAFQSEGGSWWEHVQGRLGWDVVGNSENKLRVTDGGTEYFTGLQPRGASVSVVATFTTSAKIETPGKLNPVTINELEVERAGNSKIRDTILNQYSYMPEFAGNKYEIYEIVPAASGSWVASIGSSQSVVYRVEINQAGDEVTLINSAGQKVKGTVATEDATGEVTIDTNGVTLDGMTESELIALLDEVVERLKVANAQ